MRGRVAFTAFLLFPYAILLKSGLLSERIGDDVYARGGLAHAHYTFNRESESLASRSQLKNALQLIF